MAQTLEAHSNTLDGLNSKLQAFCNGVGLPVVMLLSEGRVSDYKGTTLLADECYDADWFRAALTKRLISARIPSQSRKGE